MDSQVELDTVERASMVRATTMEQESSAKAQSSRPDGVQDVVSTPRTSAKTKKKFRKLRSLRSTANTEKSPAPKAAASPTKSPKKRPAKKSPKKKESNKDKPGEKHDEVKRETGETGEDEDKEKDKEAKKKNAHRLYMQFWRNIHQCWALKYHHTQHYISVHVSDPFLI